MVTLSFNEVSEAIDGDDVRLHTFTALCVFPDANECQ